MRQPIAILGLACRLPGAPDAQAFWSLLARGGDGITDVPEQRWDALTLHDSDLDAPGKSVSRWGGFIEGVDEFDAELFGVTPEEAERVDPQQRLVLQTAWAALEDAGIAPASLVDRRVGVFIGASHSDYERIIYRELAGIRAHDGPGAYHALIANRVSYSLGLRGPSLVIDGACSSSLSAIHVACRALEAGDCELAIAGGVNLNLTPEETIGLTKARMLSPLGRCRTFDDGAQGYVRGEGVGVVILSRGADVGKAGYRRRATVVGSSINHNGHSNGVTAPNGTAQRALLTTALREAGIEPSEVAYVEAHGTATSLGDAVEISALDCVYGRNRDTPFLVGSVKANIGHLEAASGIASLIKVVLAMERGVIPRQINFDTPNRLMDLKGSSLEIVTSERAWPMEGRRRLAGVSAFGFGGANAHVLVEAEPVAAPRPARAERAEVLVLSAKTRPALQRLAGELADHLQESQEELLDVCFTAASGRSPFPFRWATTARSTIELAGELRRWLKVPADTAAVRRPRIALWLGHNVNTDRAGWPEAQLTAWEKAADALQRRGAGTVAADEADFCAGFAAGSLLLDWGLQGTSMGGEGAGELAALCLTGVLSLDQGAERLLMLRDSPALGEQARCDTGPPRSPWVRAADGALFRHQLPAGALDQAGRRPASVGVRVALASQRCSRAVTIGEVNVDVLGTAETVGLGTCSDALPALLQTLFLWGVDLDWRAVYAGRDAHVVSLPTYPFERGKYWVRPVNAPSELALREASLGMWGQGIKLTGQAGAPARSEVAAVTPEPSAKVVDDILTWLRAYAGDRLNSVLMDERRCMPPNVVLDLGERGILGMEVPRQYGGLGLGARDCMRVFQQLAAIDLTLASFVGVHHALGTRPIMRFGDAGMREEVLPVIARGRQLTAFAVTERGAGSNPRAMEAVAIADGVGWRLYGEKEWIGNGSWAGFINVFVQEKNTQGHSIGVSGFLVRSPAPGLRQGPEALTMGMRSMVQNRVHLEGVRTTPSDRLGPPGEGFAVATDAMQYGRLGIAAMSVGAIRRCVQLLVRYASERQIITGRLLDNPLTRERLGEMTAAADALESYVSLLATLRDDGVELPDAAYMACKITGPELLWTAVDHTIQALGGRGYMEPNGLSQIMRDARLLRIFEGPTEALLMALGSLGRVELESAAVFLAERLSAPQLAQQFLTCAQSHRSSTEGQGPEVRKRHAARLGELFGWTCLAGAARATSGRSDAAAAHAVRWADNQLDRSLEQLRRPTTFGLPLLSVGDLLATVAEYQQRIGNPDQRLPGEDHEPCAELRVLSPLSLDIPAAARVQVGPELLPSNDSDGNLRTWMCERLASRLAIPLEAIDPSAPFFEMGLDSHSAVELAGELEARLGRRVNATVFWNFPTANALATHLASEEGEANVNVDLLVELIDSELGASDR